MRRFLISPINLPKLIDVGDKCSSLVIQLEVLQQGNAMQREVMGLKASLSPAASLVMICAADISTRYCTKAKAGKTSESILKIGQI